MNIIVNGFRINVEEWYNIEAGIDRLGEIEHKWVKIKNRDGKRIEEKSDDWPWESTGEED